MGIGSREHALLAAANEPRFGAVSPARCAPMLADEGVYLGSEPSMARVLRTYGLERPPGAAPKCKEQRNHRPPTLQWRRVSQSRGSPRQCWSCSALAASTAGSRFNARESPAVALINFGFNLIAQQDPWI